MKCKPPCNDLQLFSRKRSRQQFSIDCNCRLKFSIIYMYMRFIMLSNILKQHINDHSSEATQLRHVASLRLSQISVHYTSSSSHRQIPSKTNPRNPSRTAGECLGEKIRTSGLLNPIQARYQTAPHPDIEENSIQRPLRQHQRLYHESHPLSSPIQTRDPPAPLADAPAPRGRFSPPGPGHSWPAHGRSGNPGSPAGRSHPCR